MLAKDVCALDAAQLALQHVAQGANFLLVARQITVCLLECGRKTHDAGDVLGTRATAELLPTAQNETHGRKWLVEGPIAACEQTHALGAVELVGRDAQHVDAHGLDVDGDVPRALHGVGMKERACLMSQPCRFLEGLHGSHLVVDCHEAHSAHIGSHGLGDVFRRYDALAVGRQQCHAEALDHEFGERVENGRMFYLRRYDARAAVCLTPCGGGAQRLVVGLAASRGEHDLAGLAAKLARHIFARLVYGVACGAAGAVLGAGVGARAAQIWQHRLKHRRVHVGGSSIVEIDHANPFRRVVNSPAL